jgi:hypothetical protein
VSMLTVTELTRGVSSPSVSRRWPLFHARTNDRHLRRSTVIG